MKAAPDKIYLPIIEEEGKRLLCTIWWENDAKSTYVKETIPYIRKDAILEWIQETRAIPHENAIVRDLTFQEVVNKLNSL